jgi:hypothetical protein
VLLEQDKCQADMQYRCDFLLEYKLRNQQPNYNICADMDKMEQASFLPLEIFLDTIASNGTEPEDLAFSTKWASILYTGAFNLHPSTSTPIIISTSTVQSC